MRSGLLFSVIVSIILCVPVFAYDWATNPGDGSPENPYQVSTAEQMNAIGLDTTLWDKHFKLTADIDMSSLGTEDYNIIGYCIDYITDVYFTGFFNGNDHIIQNLTINQPDMDFVGVFGCTNNATISNLGLENVNIVGRSMVGGLVGENQGLVVDCSVSGSVSGEFLVGGLIGNNHGGILIGCHATGSVEGDAGIGGLVGGIYGGTLNSCHATGSVNGNISVGGLVGGIYGGSTLISCYSTGSVEGVTDVGGLIGDENGGLVISSFWDIQTSGQLISQGGEGKSTAEMKSLSTYIDAGWDFVNESANGFHDYWMMETNDYPRFALGQWLLEGAGTDSNPYKVATPSDLGQVWQRPGGYYQLSNNIDLSGTTWSIPVISKFEGTFNGQGFTISNLSIDQPDLDYVGLFGQTCEDAQIQDLSLENVDITGRSSVGGLVGFNNSAALTSCHVSGTVYGQRGVGGLIGENMYGTVINSDSTVDVHGVKDRVGGLIGRNYRGVLSTCFATGSVNSADDYIGGLTGYSDGISTYNCYAAGSVSGDSYVGGLTGYTINNTLISCYATGSVTGSKSVGGLVGQNSHSTLLACFSTGSVVGKYAGGLVGNNSYYGNVIGCYASGTASGFQPGGLIGDNADDNIILHSFWDVETSGLGTSGSIHKGAIGKTTAEMRTLTTFTDVGWDFVGETANGLHDFWQMDPNDYPRFPLRTWTLAGEGTPGKPYLISDATDLGKVWLRSSACYRLNSNLDLSGISWSYPVIPTFSGVFDGHGHIVSNLYIQQPDIDHVGMFGTVDNCGQIQNVGIQYAYIYGRGDVGGLVGRNDGTIYGCHTAGQLTGQSGVGGMVGFNRSGTIDNSYATASVIGSLQMSTHLGGLVGRNQYKLNNCYSTGPIVCGSDAYIGIYNGGLVGSHDYSYDRINACFWDTQTSGLEVSDGGTGKTTAEMQTLNTFTDAGWDFFFETANGTEEIWFIREGIHYPKLSWEHHRSVASAGNDQTVYASIDGLADVSLDGTDSYDPDGDVLEYFWFDANELIATGAEPNVVLGVGEHVIELIVSDGVEDSEPNACVVTVIGPLETEARVLPRTLNLKSNRQHIIGYLKLAGSQPELDADQPMLLLAGEAGIEAMYQRLVYSRHERAWYWVGIFDGDAVTDNVPAGNNVPITLVSRFNTGQWIYGTDTIHVINPSPQKHQYGRNNDRSERQAPSQSNKHEGNGKEKQETKPNQSKNPSAGRK